MKLKKNLRIILIMMLMISTLILAGCTKKNNANQDANSLENTVQTEDTTESTTESTLESTTENTLESTTENTAESTIESTTDAEKENVTSDATGKLVMTVNDAKINMDELMYYIYSVEQEGNYYDQMYQANYGTGYWDTEAEKGVTMRDVAKKYVTDTSVMYEILYEKAIKADYKLSEEEKASCVSYSDKMYTALTVDELKITGLKKDVIVKLYEKMTLAEKYYTFITDGLGLDEKAITAGEKLEDYKQYDTKALFVANTKKDKSNNSTKMTADELKKAKESIENALKKVKAGDDFNTIVAADKTVLTNAITFVSGDKKVGAEYEKATLALKVGANSDIVEATDGYYIIQLVDNTSTASYDTAVKDAIALAKSEGFNKEYEKLKKDYKITIDEKIWDTIVMGETTIPSAK